MIEAELKSGEGLPLDGANVTSWSSTLGNILKGSSSKRTGCVILSKRKKVKQLIEPKEEQCCDQSLNKSELQSNLWISRGRVRPNILEKDKEKSLQKIAVRGVVQLFNAVQTHQKSITKELEVNGKSEIKLDATLRKVDRNCFFDTLLGERKKNTSQEIQVKVEEKFDETPLWEPLQEDFNLTPKMKDWDKKES